MRTQITSAKPEVPYGRGPGPAKVPWELCGFRRSFVLFGSHFEAF